MPITVTCNECSEQHRLKDDAVGKRFQCKGCGKSLKVEATPPPDDDFDDVEQASVNDEFDESVDADAVSKRVKSVSRSSSKSKSERPKSVPLRKTKVPLGIDCVYFGFLLTVAVMFGAFALDWSFRGNLRVLLPGLLGLLLLGFAANILTTVGKLMCLTAPPQMSGRWSISLSAAIDLLALAVGVAGHFRFLSPFVVAASKLIPIIGFLFFLLFLKQLGDFLGERDISERATGVAAVGIGIVVLWLAIILQLFVLPMRAAMVVGLLIGVILLIVGVIGAIRYLRLLTACRYALSNCRCQQPTVEFIIP